MSSRMGRRGLAMATPPFNTAAMAHMLDHDNHETRKGLKEVNIGPELQSGGRADPNVGRLTGEYIDMPPPLSPSENVEELQLTLSFIYCSSSKIRSLCLGTR